MDFETVELQTTEFDEIKESDVIFNVEQTEGLDQAPCIEIQAEEISEVFLEHPELRFENWEQMSLDERVNALQAFENDIAQIEHRDALPVVCEEMKENVYGYFYEGDMLLHLNACYLEDDDYESYLTTMDTLFHEGRHAYQYANISGEHVVEQNQEYVKVWEMNFNENEWGYRSVEIYGYEDYFMQPIEVDARAFAGEVMNQIGLR